MNEYIKLGEINQLKIDRVSEPGVYLVSQTQDESVLLPNAYITSKMQIGDILEVFIYTDSEDRLVATTQTPYVKKDEFALLEVIDSSKFGAFMDMGLPKDLLVPKNRQKTPFKVGEKRFVRVIEDEKTNRLIGVEKFASFLKNATGVFEINDEVEILLFAKTPLGFKVVVNNDYEGMIFHNEIFEMIHVGDKRKAYIKNVREDGKLDIALQQIGSKSNDESQNKILSHLEQNGGFMEFTSKSDAEDIKKTFGLSKKNFKASLTKLLSLDKIENVQNGVKLKK